VAPQLTEPGIKYCPPIVPVNHCRLLIINQHFVGDTAKVGKRLHQRPIRMVGVQPRHGNHVERSTKAQRVDCQIHGLLDTTNGEPLLSPIVLQLLARCGLEPYRARFYPLLAQRLDKIANTGIASGVSCALQLPEYHRRVPDIVGKQRVYLCGEGIKFTAAYTVFTRWRL